MKNFDKFCKLLQILVATATLASAPSKALAGDAVIFAGTNTVKALADNLNLNNKLSLLTGTDNPTSVAKSAPQGSLYLRYGASGGTLYSKQDAGLTTNWSSIGSTAAAGSNGEIQYNSSSAFAGLTGSGVDTSSGLLGINKTAPLASVHAGVKTVTIGDPSSLSATIHVGVNAGYTFLSGNKNYQVYSQATVNGVEFYSNSSSGATFTEPAIADFDPTSAALIINYAGGGYTASGYSFQYTVWALYPNGQISNGSTVSNSDTDDSSSNPCFLDVSWTPPVGQTPIGYLILSGGSNPNAGMYRVSTTPYFSDQNSGWSSSASYSALLYGVTLSFTGGAGAMNYEVINTTDTKYQLTSGATNFPDNNNFGVGGGFTTPSSYSFPSIVSDGTTELVKYSGSLGIFGATPVSQRSGDIATGLSTYGLIAAPTLGGDNLRYDTGGGTSAIFSGPSMLYSDGSTFANLSTRAFNFASGFGVDTAGNATLRTVAIGTQVNGSGAAMGQIYWSLSGGSLTWNNGSDKTFLFDSVALNGSTVTGTLPVSKGGTGITSGTSGGIPYYSASGTIASSGALTANRIVLGGGAATTPGVLGSLGTTTTLLHGNAAGAPTFGAVSLTADVSGTLPVANGGTGVTTSTGTVNNVLSASPTLTGTLSTDNIAVATNKSVTIGPAAAGSTASSANQLILAGVPYQNGTNGNNGWLQLNSSSDRTASDRSWGILNNQSAAGELGFYVSASATTAPVIYSASPDAPKLAITSAGVVRIPGLSTGLAHSDSSGNLTSSTLVNADVNASAAIAYSKLALTGAILNADLAGSIADTKLSQITTASKVSVTAITGTLPLANGGTNATTIAGLTAQFTAPTVQKFTSGSGTYTTPANAKYIRLIAAGAGGGGAGSGTGAGGGSGGNGGNSTFGSSLHTAAGGSGGVNNSTGGAGGAATIGTGGSGAGITGGRGGGASSAIGLAIDVPGGGGGTNALGGAQPNSGGAVAGAAGATNTGAGGSGGGSPASATANISGDGGGAGAYLNILIPSPSASYAYAVGAAGTAGTAGTSGFAGGAGGSGVVIIEEYYQ